MSVGFRQRTTEEIREEEITAEKSPTASEFDQSLGAAERNERRTVQVIKSPLRGEHMIALTAVDAALDRLEGMVNSFVRGSRGRKRGATMSQVYGQYESARRYGASQDQIRARITHGMNNPPSAISERVAEIRGRFLQ